LKTISSTPQNPLKLYFVVLEDQIDEFGWSYTGDLKLDPEVQKLENKTVDELKSTSDSLGLVKTGVKDVLIKRILNHKNITAKTTKDIMNEIEASLKIYKICLPKDPSSSVKDVLERFHEK